MSRYSSRGVLGVVTLSAAFWAAGGCDSEKIIDLALEIVTTSLPDGTVGAAYTEKLASVGGSGSTAWASTALPTGLALDASSGEMSGMPVTEGTTSFQVVATNSGKADTRSLSITILPMLNSSLSVVTGSPLPNGRVGSAYSQTLAAVGGDGSFTWSTAGLPNGLSLAGTSGEISGVPTTEGTTNFIMQVDSDGQAATKEFAITVTPELGGGTPYPNEPPGLTRFAELDYSGLPSIQGSQGVLDGNWATLSNPASLISVQSDPSASQSPPGVLQLRFQPGTVAGFPPPNGQYRLFTGWDGPNNLSNTEYSEIYESTWIKMVGTDFETQEVGVKSLGYWGVGANNQNPATGPGPVQIYHLFTNLHEGGPGTSIETQWRIDGYTQGVNSLFIPSNRNLGTNVQAGQWHQFEIYLKLNDMGSANGIWRWWLDGVLIGERTDMVFVTPALPSGFFGRDYDPVWGGQGGAARSRDDYIWLDHTYISGVFLRPAGGQ
jgi:Putative Ig domain